METYSLEMKEIFTEELESDILSDILNKIEAYLLCFLYMLNTYIADIFQKNIGKKMFVL